MSNDPLKTTELGENSDPQYTDLILTVSDPAGTPINKKVQIGNLKLPANRIRISKASHGFVAGDVLYANGIYWEKAKADDIATAHAVGVVESATSNVFILVLSGYMNTPTLSENTIYYLSDTASGLLTAEPPTDPDSFLVPILITGYTNEGYVGIQKPMTLALIKASDTDFAKKNNFGAMSAPGSGNDNTQGYANGSFWTTSAHAYICLGAATGAANWVQIDGTGGGGGDTTAPTLVSATIEADGVTMTLVFDENVEAGADGFLSGLSIAGVSVGLTAPSGTGTDTLVYGLDTTILETDAGLTLNYDQPGDGIQDAAANVLASFADVSITNASTQTGGGGGGGLLTDLVAYWKMDEASGNRADSVGGQTLTDHSVGSSAGKLNALAADFSSSYLDRADSSVLSIPSDTDFTITGWIYPRANAYGGIFGKSGVSGLGYNADCEYVISTVDFNGTNLGLYFNASDGSSIPSATNNNHTKNAWHFFVAWYDSAAGYLYLQVDNGTPGSVASAHGSFDSTSALYVGKFGAGFNYDGKLENVGLWKRVLTPEERASLWNSGNGLPFASF